KPANPLSHEMTTGPEIWSQTAGRITHFVAGIGTGGTITGVGRYLKSRNPEVQIVGADPEGSVFSGGSGRPYLVEGVGEDFWPTTFDVIDARSDALPPLVRVHPDSTARVAIEMLRRLDVSQLVVASQEPPLQAKEVEGSVRELELMHEISRDPGVLDRPVSEVQ